MNEKTDPSTPTLAIPLQRDTSGRRILITGGVGKIGRRVVNLYRTVLPDAQILVADLEGARAEAFRAECPGAQFLAVDFLQEPSIEALVAKLVTDAPLTDLIAVHGGVGDALWETDESTEVLTTAQMIFLNLTSVVVLTGALIDRQVLRGTPQNFATATFTSSVNRYGGYRCEPYAAGKAGLLGAVREFAATHGTKSMVRANAVTPGTVIDTWAGKARQRMEQMAPVVPLGQYAHADHIAHAILLLTEQLVCTTGQEIVVDAGQLLLRLTPRNVDAVTAIEDW